MSTIKMIAIFPEGRAAENVLAVGLDDETTDYLSTYPGTAHWINRYAREKLASDLREVGREENEVPGLISALRNHTANAEELQVPYPRAWSILAGCIAFCLGHLLLGTYDVDSIPRFLAALAIGFGMNGFISASFTEKQIKQRTRDEECKRIYAERLRESAANLIRLNDKGTNTIRCAINCVNTIHNHLAQLHRQGLSTVDETAAADDAFNEVVQGHMDERTATARSKRYQTILREVDSETIASDEDLHHVQQLSDDQRRALRDAKDRIGNAMTELKTLMAATAKSARDTTAKLSAAKMRSEEWKAQQPPAQSG